MTAYSNPFNRMWKCYTIGDNPLSIMGGARIELAQALANIDEEFDGQKSNIRAWATHDEAPATPGDVYQGKKFILVCVS